MSTLKTLWTDVITAFYPEGSRHDEAATALLSRGTYQAGISFIIALMLGALIFFGREVPLWAVFSTGSIATGIGAVAGGTSTVIGYWRSNSRSDREWRRELPLVQRVADTVAVTVLHVTILVLISSAVFFALQNAFPGLEVDAFTATMITACGAAIASYTMYLSAVILDARRLSTLLAIFLLAGVMVSMVTVQNPEWWQFHFSELGTGNGISRYSFNATLVVGGFVMATIAFYISADLRAWEKTAPTSRRRSIPVVQWALVIIGLMLAGVGLVPLDLSVLIHNTFAGGMAVAFIALLVALRRVLDGIPRAMIVFSDAVLLGLVFSLLLWVPLGYYNLTAFELIAAALLFTWLIVLIRNVGALVGVDEEALVEATV